MIKARILVSLLNANEPTAQLAEVFVQEGEWVEANSPICVLETTKATVEVTTPEAGYVRQLNVLAEDTVSVGDLICVITDSPNESIEISPRPEVTDLANSLVPDGLRITKPALALAQELDIDLSQLSQDGIITESIIKDIAGLRNPDRDLLVQNKVDMRVIIYGGGGHAKAVIELIRQLQTYRIAGIVDDGLAPGTDILGVSVIGSRDILLDLIDDGIRLAINAIGGITDIATRVGTFNALADLGFAFPSLRHRHSIVEPSAVLEDGVQVFANSYVGSDVILREGCIINTGAIVSHDCIVGEYTHITPGAILAGGVHVGTRTLIGMGVATGIGICIGNNVRIGNGALVHQDVPDGTIILAGTTWPSPRQG